MLRFVASLAAVLVALAAQAADPRKVVRSAYSSAESRLDPQAESDEASGAINDSIFDALLQYDYLARPAKLQPRAAEALPEIREDGRVFILRVKPGLYFPPDPEWYINRPGLSTSPFDSFPTNFVLDRFFG